MYLPNRKFNHIKSIGFNLLLIAGAIYAFNQSLLPQCAENLASPSVDLNSWQFYAIVGYFTLSFVAVIIMQGKFYNMLELLSRVLTALTSSLIGSAILLYLVYGMPVFHSIYTAF